MTPKSMATKEKPIPLSNQRIPSQDQSHNMWLSLFKQRWLVAISIVLLFVSLAYGLIGLPQYETNDDLTMTAIASGTAYLDRPDEHLLFCHTFVGMLLKQLYTAAPAVPWYGIYQTTSLLIGMSVIAWLVLGKSKRPVVMLGIAAATLLITTLRPLLLMQFTLTGAIIGSAGALLMFECVERWHLRKRAIACAIGAAALFALATMVRQTSAFLVLLITCMFIVSRFSPTLFRQWRKLTAQLLAAAVAFMIVFTLSQISDSYYQGEWKDFYPSNIAATSIREYRCDSIISFLSSLMYKHIGWDNADVSLFFSSYRLDENVYSQEKLNTLNNLMKEWWKTNFDIGRAIEAVKLLLNDQSFLPLVLPVLLLIPLVNRAKFPFLSIVLFTVGLFSLFVYFILFMKLPIRVLISIITVSTLLGMRYVSMSKISNVFTRNPLDRSTIRRTIYATIALSMIVPSFFLMKQMKGLLKSISSQEQLLKEAIRGLSPQPDQLYVQWAWCLPTIVGPFSDMGKAFHNFNVLFVGTHGPTPFVKSRMRKFGISDLLRQLDKDNVYLISNKDYNRIIRTSVARKYGMETVFTPVPNKVKYFQVFKVKYVKPANPETFKRDWDVQLVTGK